jgi:F-box domain
MAPIKDWSSLPPEVLNLIAKQVREISDFVRFRAVCTAWRFSTPTSDLPPQFPWIHECQGSSSDPALSFYSMSFHKFYTIHSSKSSDPWLSELSQGYFLSKLYDFTDSRSTAQLSLLNPLNNHQIPIPACNYYPYWFGQRQNKIGDYEVYCALPCQNSNHQLAFCHLARTAGVILNSIATSKSLSLYS